MENSYTQSWGDAAAEAGTHTHQAAQEHQCNRHQGQQELAPPHVCTHIDSTGLHPVAKWTVTQIDRTNTPAEWTITQMSFKIKFWLENTWKDNNNTRVTKCEIMQLRKYIEDKYI